MAIDPPAARSFYWPPRQASSSHPELSLLLSTFPRQLDLFVILDYSKWKENDEEQDDESLLEITPFDTSSIYSFSGTPAGIYYIIGYFNTVDLLHEVIHVRPGIEKLDFKITLQADGTPELEAGPGIRIITSEIGPLF